MTDLAGLGVGEAAAAVRNGTCAARELVDAVLARAALTEPHVHAYSFLDADGAREQAATADAAVREGRELGLLHGVPVAVKDLIDVRGLPTTGGSRALGDLPAVVDAVAVRLLREAGAIVLGKTVTTELGLGGNVPATRNARNPGRAPGGSSAGSAVAVAVCSAFAALGTDTGGSVRVPAAVNGVTGFKPSRGAIPTAGVLPMSRPFDTVGLLGRSATDVRLLFEVLAPGGEPRDAPRIARLDTSALPGIDAELEVLVSRAAEVLAGGDLVSAAWPLPGVASASGMYVAAGDTAAVHRDLLRDRWADLAPGTRVSLLAGAALPGRTRHRAEALCGRLEQAAAGLFDTADLLVAPAFPVVAQGPEDIVGGRRGAMSTAMDLQMLANIAGLPAITVPCGPGPDGLPYGVQLLGRPGADRTVLGAAARFQERTTWHLPR